VHPNREQRSHEQAHDEMRRASIAADLRRPIATSAVATSVHNVVSSFIVPLPKKSQTTRENDTAGETQIAHLNGMNFALFRRSAAVSTFPGRWAACSGYIEKGEAPVMAAEREIREETRLKTVDILVRGRPFRVESKEARKAEGKDEGNAASFVVHPFLAGAPAADVENNIEIDWEHEEWRLWTRHELAETASTDTVPLLLTAFDRCGHFDDGVLASSAVRARITGLDDVRLNRRDGSSALALRALTSLAALQPASHEVSAAAFRETVLNAAYSLSEARPTMVTIGNRVAATVRRWDAHLDRSDEAAIGDAQTAAAVLASVAGQEALAIRQDSQRIAENFVAAMPSQGTLLTLSNSTVVRTALSGLPSPFKIVVCESRPGLEGADLARSLSAAGGHDTTLVVDSAAHVASGEVSGVVVGADSVHVGDRGGRPLRFVNKIGTQLLADVAARRGVPLWILTDSSKFCDAALTCEPLEVGKPGEILPPESARGIRMSAFNPTFETVEVDSGVDVRFVTEKGVHATGGDMGHIVSRASDNAYNRTWLASL
jgi:ribose 1,5-bisphosphate isomerase